jgi:hypothetical protein
LAELAAELVGLRLDLLVAAGVASFAALAYPGHPGEQHEW